MFPSSSSQPLIYPSLGFADVPFNSQSSFPSQSQTDLSQGNDPNSPEVFKQNVHLIQQQLSRTQDLARSALFGIENAYRPGTSPTQTSECLIALRQSLHILVEMLRQSGVGALPMVDLSALPQSVPTEEKLLEDIPKSIEVQYAQQKRIQESAAIVFNLLGSVEQAVRRP
ncbi:hypothetical protein BC629DRAFT_617136 [Irpex lacteus]|nr:hypothetical protein BC629DRAFT_617136 [Irpex lacteus]